MRLILLFTSFPVATETFLQREVAALRRAEVPIEVWSLWKGEPRVEGHPIRIVPLATLFFLVGWIPFWLVKRPRACRVVMHAVLRDLRWRNWTNFGENLIGIALGMACARKIESEATPDTVLHAVWASMPAAFGWVVHQLTGLPFSFAGHAYDLFEDGGDGLIGKKLEAAFGIRTSTRAGLIRLRELGADPAAVSVIRRGLLDLPAVASMRSGRHPVRLVTVGRFVSKMGYDLLGQVFDELVRRGIPFEARLVGSGSEMKSFETRRMRSKWSENVQLLGAQPFTAVEATLRWGDILLFTGQVASSGDRAGFPNVIGEAMAVGRPVVATEVGAVPEVLEHGVNGLLAHSAVDFVDGIEQLSSDDVFYAKLAGAGRFWTEREFNLQRNMAVFMDWIASRVIAEA